MDPNQLLPFLQGVFTGPNGFLYAIAVFFALQWAKEKWPDSPLLKWLPKLTPNPTPAPTPSGGPTGRPLLDALLGMIGHSAAEQVLAGEVQRMVKIPPPEPASPIAEGRSGRVSLPLLLAFLVGFAAVFGLGRSMIASASPASSTEFREGYSLISAGGYAGLWVEPNGANGPYAALYSQRPGSYAVLGFSSAKSDPKFGRAHDLAFCADATGVHIQVFDDAGKVHVIPASALIRLEQLPAAAGDVSTADPEALDIPIANRLVYRLARDKAAEIYAKEHKVTEAAARAKLAKVSDSSLHTAFKASKLAHPVGDTLEDVLRWLVDHKELIFEVAKLLIALLALL